MRRLLALTPFLQTHNFCHISTSRPFRAIPALVTSTHLHTPIRHRRFLAMTHSKSADDTPTVTFDFKEEPIGLPPSEGFGYLDVDIGDELGPDNRFVILRKLRYASSIIIYLSRDWLGGRKHICYYTLKRPHIKNL